MRIVIGSGKRRVVFEVPAGPSRVIGKDGKTEVLKRKDWREPRERIAEDIKAFLFRPATLARAR